uniref:E3 ubiquitin-protein ligase RNF10 n=1 Tax=Cacopsylla melanoneura TaxID=428564 RepID=A0A8D9AM76_9HEMI
MSEDHTMDKKNRSAQGASKGNGSESKKSQDVATSKQYPKQRRREPAGSIKNEASGRSKMLPQKFKSFDKRPKPRGGIACGKESTKINFYDGDEPELGSLYSPGSKKQNLNHLLNFQYASPPSHYGSGGGRSSYTTRSHGAAGYNNYLMQSLASVHKHKYNKEQFLQANCQFVVRAGEDYAVHLGDPDTLVKWEFIQQIRGFGNEDIKCPICLDLPRAPQLTRCGHCFCWPCILHYLALSDKSWRKCPICYEAVHLNDLKSFRSVIKHPRAVNEVVTFQLMKRERGSMVVGPVAQWDLHATDMLMNVSETTLDTLYAKLLSATLDDILEMIKVEEDDLTLLLEELRQEQCPTLCFTERALELLQNRRTDILNKMGSKNDLTKMETSPPNSSSTENDENNQSENTNEKTPLSAVLPSSGNSGDYQDEAAAVLDRNNEESELPESSVRVHLDSESASYRTTSVSSVDSSGTGHETLDCSVSMSLSGTGHDDTLDFSAHYDSMSHPGGTQPSRFFYFYQASDGQQLFLHAVNVRMLEMTYGSLELCPPTITGRILEKETGSMTENLRRRLRYLQHLPVTCQFEVAEIDLKPPLISDDTMERYRDQLVSRERRRLKRAREDKRRAARIEEAEYVQMRGGGVGMSNRRRGNLHIESHLQFPECGVGGIPGLDNALASCTDYSTESSRASSPRRPDSPLTTALIALSLEQHNQQQQQTSSQSAPTSSFAQRLRAGSSLSAEDNSIFWPSVGETDSRRRTLSEESTTLPPTTSTSYTPSLPTPAPTQGEAQGGERGGVGNGQGGGNNGQGGGQNKKKKRKQQTLLFATGGMKVNK